MFNFLTKEGKIVVGTLLGILLVTGLIVWKMTSSKIESNITTQEMTASTTTKPVVVEELELTMSIPLDTQLRKEIAVNGDVPRTTAFYVERDGYTLYGLYENFHKGTQEDIEKSKSEMKPETIKDVFVDGYPAVEGEITGPKSRYITVFLKDGVFMSLSTIPPTPENKNTTDQILGTLKLN